jgi:tyrosyl-tRNA synthetase
MSFAEFAYPLMQAWDWWHMWSSTGVQLQIGGSDQYGNIVTGVDALKIIRDSETNPAEQMPSETVLDDPVGFTVPLLTDSSGAKFGKSAGNALWLDPVQTSHFDLYGYLVGRPDDDVERLLKLFTFIPLPELEEVMRKQNEDPSRRYAQHLLAYEVVRLVHGKEVAAATQKDHRTMFGGEVDTVPEGEPLAGPGKGARSEEDDEYAAVEGHPTDPNNAPRVDMKLPEHLIKGSSIARILYASGLATSTSDGQRTVVQKGAYIGGSPGQKAHQNKGMSEHQIQFTPVSAWRPEDTQRFLIDGKILILRKGKHNLRVIEMVSDEWWKRSGKTYPGQPYTGKVRMLNAKLKAAKEALAEGQTSLSEDEIDVEGELGEVKPDPDSQDLVFPKEYSERMGRLRDEYVNLKQRLQDKRESIERHSGGSKVEERWMRRGSPKVSNLRAAMASDADKLPRQTIRRGSGRTTTG